MPKTKHRCLGTSGGGVRDRDKIILFRDTTLEFSDTPRLDFETKQRKGGEGCLVLAERLLQATFDATSAQMRNDFERKVENGESHSVCAVSFDWLIKSRLLKVVSHLGRMWTRKPLFWNPDNQVVSLHKKTSDGWKG